MRGVLRRALIHIVSNGGRAADDDFRLSFYAVPAAAAKFVVE